MTHGSKTILGLTSLKVFFVAPICHHSMGPSISCIKTKFTSNTVDLDLETHGVQ